MKYAYILVAILLISSNSIKAENNINFGVGIGALYSGLGVNINTVNNGNMFYGAYGCQSHSSLAGTLCGAGVGWVTTNLFDTDKHGLGIYYGLIDGSTTYRNGEFDWNEDDGFMLGYYYFSNGISNDGLTAGIALSDESIWLQLGYQF